MSWKKFDGSVAGTKVPGDQSVPATKWYNIWWLWLFGWKRVAVFEANTSEAFKVGFKNFKGETSYRTSAVESQLFRVRVGREDCTFFALNQRNEEVSLKLVRITDKSDPASANIPLI